MTNKLYFGDNLDVLRESVRPESVDLIYLDPPFNSNATYNVLFKEPGGAPAEAQVEAFRSVALMRRPNVRESLMMRPPTEAAYVFGSASHFSASSASLSHCAAMSANPDLVTSGALFANATQSAARSRYHLALDMGSSRPLLAPRNRMQCTPHRFVPATEARGTVSV